MLQALTISLDKQFQISIKITLGLEQVKIIHIYIHLYSSMNDSEKKRKKRNDYNNYNVL